MLTSKGVLTTSVQGSNSMTLTGGYSQWPILTWRIYSSSFNSIHTTLIKRKITQTRESGTVTTTYSVWDLYGQPRVNTEQQIRLYHVNCCRPLVIGFTRNKGVVNAGCCLILGPLVDGQGTSPWAQMTSVHRGHGLSTSESRGPDALPDSKRCKHAVFRKESLK